MTKMDIKQLEIERTRLDVEIATLDEACTRIRAQLEHSDADGNPDRHWRADATCSLRHRNRKLQELQSERGKINRQIRTLEAKAFDARFIDVARKVLPKETYVAILSQVSPN
jgi:septal ring factor EnvC (AmiA/AmiB activator)